MRAPTRIHRPAAILVALSVLVLAAPAALAGPYDGLFGHVPSSAVAVVAVDQTRLVAHPGYKQLRSLAAAQGGARGIAALEGLGLAPGKDITRSVTYRIGRYAEAAIMQGPGLKAAAVEAAARKKLAGAFATGEVAGKPWFLAAKKVQAAQLGDDIIVIGSGTAVKKALQLAAGKGKSIKKKTGFKAMIKAASANGPTIFGASWIPKRDRAALTEQGADDLAAVLRTHFSAVGADSMAMTLVAHTASAAEAKKVADGVSGKIDRKLVEPMPMRLMGVSALAKTIKVVAKGKTAVATSTLTSAQIAALAGTAGKVIKVLEAQAKAHKKAAAKADGGSTGDEAASPQEGAK